MEVYNSSDAIALSSASVTTYCSFIYRYLTGCCAARHWSSMGYKAILTLYQLLSCLDIYRDTSDPVCWYITLWNLNPPRPPAPLTPVSSLVLHPPPADVARGSHVFTLATRHSSLPSFPVQTLALPSSLSAVLA